MKVILSRKGFDSATGGYPSPIIDGRLCSLPIPESDETLTYGDVSWEGESLGRIVSDLTRGHIKPTRPIHLDPDLRADSLSRLPGWRPMFGQAFAAQRHLEKAAVGTGDIFLFFGWCREAQRTGGQYRYKPKARDLHVLFGWLAVNEVWRRHQILAAPDWARRHPHVLDHGRTNNAIYVATPGGGGVFQSLKDDLILTAKGKTRSIWSLPSWFHPQGRRSALSYHDAANRWSWLADTLQLRSAGRGQEFVLDSKDYPEVKSWALDLIAENSSAPEERREPHLPTHAETPRPGVVRIRSAPAPAQMALSENHTHRSSYREILIEHLFVGEVMRRLWLRDITQFEVLKPQVDDSGYDLVLEANGVVRHVQLKASYSESRTGRIKASLKLAQKPSGCVVWILFDPQTMALGPYRWFGGKPGEAMPDIKQFPVARHTRGNAEGIKKERPNQRSIPKARFAKVDNLDALVTLLFGRFPNGPQRD